MLNDKIEKKINWKKSKKTKQVVIKRMISNLT